MLRTSFLRKPTASKPAKEIDVQIDFDWTYTSAFSGAFMSLEEAKERQGVSVEWTSKTIDYEILKRREPILFYTSLSLYEDELHDHGHTGYTVKLVRRLFLQFILLDGLSSVRLPPPIMQPVFPPFLPSSIFFLSRRG